jgi:hypothetical protein
MSVHKPNPRDSSEKTLESPGIHSVFNNAKDNGPAAAVPPEDLI